MTDELKSGWGWPLTAKKAHFFSDDIRSLCGKWLFSGHLTPDVGTSRDDCAACRKKLDKGKSA